MLKAILFLIPLLAFAADEAIDVGFDVLAGFEYKEKMELPESVTKFDGKLVNVQGFPRSFDGESEDLKEFWLVSQNCDCEGQPKWNEMIFCTMPEGMTISIDDEPVRLQGILSVGELWDGEYLVSVYRMKVTKLR